MIVIVAICLIPALVIFIFLMVPVRFSGLLDVTYPERLIEGKISGLVLSANIYTMPGKTHKRHKNVILTIKERFYMTFALMNIRFDPSCLINYLEHTEDVIITKDMCERDWKELSEMDVNKDGKITKKEFTYWILKQSVPWRINGL